MRNTTGAKLTRDTPWEEEGSAKSVGGRESKRVLVVRGLREGAVVKDRRGPARVGLFAVVVQGRGARSKVRSRISIEEMPRISEERTEDGAYARLVSLVLNTFADTSERGAARIRSRSGLGREMTGNVLNTSRGVYGTIR